MGFRRFPMAERELISTFRNSMTIRAPPDSVISIRSMTPGLRPQDDLDPLDEFVDPFPGGEEDLAAAGREKSDG